MSTIKPIRTEADYQAALARVAALMDAEPGTPAGEELDLLTDLIEHYGEARPDGVSERDRGDRVSYGAGGLTQRDLVPLIGSRRARSGLMRAGTHRRPDSSRWRPRGRCRGPDPSKSERLRCVPAAPDQDVRAER